MNDSHSQGQDSLDALLDAAVDAIILADQRGVILRFNPAAQRLFGFTERDILGRNVSELMPEPDHSRHDRYIKRYLDGGRPAIIGSGREITGLHASGAMLPLHLSVGEIKGGGEARFVGIIRDLSAEKETEHVVRELERHLAHADRLVVLGEITAGIAHEINQPLTAIAAFADAGARLLDQDAPEARQELETICRRISEQARRAGDVVSRLRGLSRRGEASKSSQDLGALLNTVLHLFEHELNQNGIQLDVKMEQELPMLAVDEIQIQQVLVNLIKNSIDSLLESGTSQPEIQLSMARQGDQIDIRVTDNGPGVAAELIPRLFEPFFTTKRHGVGLGLSICKNIAVAHGGNLAHFASRDGGAGFVLSLPTAYIG